MTEAPAPSATAFCHACGTPVDPRAEICPHCGVRLRPLPIGKNRVVAALLAIFLGGLGAHKFYLGRTGWGIAYLLLCWTLLPCIVGIVEGLMYLAQSDAEFAAKYGS
jgi:TM2 domain-containing membrane protein YozV